MRFLDPVWLLLLLALPIGVLAWLALDRRRSRYAVRYTNLEVLATVAERAPRWRRLAPLALVVLALAAALIAVSRPEVRASKTDERAAVALVLDVSGSMNATDVQPTRLEAAVRAMGRFLDVLPAKFRVGFIPFAGEAFVAAPLTHDRKQVRDQIRYGFQTGRGTAIGDAVARAVEMLQPLAQESQPGGSAPPRRGAPRSSSAILLLSDGAQRGGLLQPLEGAARAKSYGIPVYTVALGTVDDNAAPDPNQAPGQGGFNSGFNGRFSFAPDPETLRQVARATGGETFATDDADKLTRVYEELASRLGRTPGWRQVGDILLAVAALLALGAAALSLRWVHRLP